MAHTSTLVPLIALLAAALPTAAHAQRNRGDWLDDCRSDRDSRSDDRVRQCEVRELTIAAPARTIRVDGGQNGGVEVRGEARRDVSIEARLEAQASSESEAREILSAIRIDTTDGSIRADGPSTSGRRSWSVSFVVAAPRQSDLDLRAHNGGVSVSEISGRMELRTLNGGLHLTDVAGDVHGETTNGGLHVSLAGDRWDGSGLDVRTQNGGVHLDLPARYAAHLETGTTNGGMSIDFPITVQGRIGRHIETDLNGGGTTIRAVTTNGGVEITRR